MKQATGSTMLLAALTLLVAGPASASGATSRSAKDEAVAAVSAAALDVDTYLDRGDAHFTKRNYSAARRQYRVAAKLTRADGEVPIKALRRIANAHYYEGRYQSAANTLEKLAREAAEYGDLVTQAWAIADAAWVAGRAGAKIDVDRRLVRLERLLGSPYLPDDVRQAIRTQRLGEESVTIVEHP
jgi:tetratricopeptide (TPR) repeat protein